MNEEKKLTDEEIIKSLECCINKVCGRTEDCPLHSENDCIEIMSKNALDLIHRLQSENEDLKAKQKCHLELIDDKNEEICKQKAEIERLTEELDLANETIDRNNKRYEKVSIERQKALDRVDYLEDALLEKIRRNEELITAIKQAEQKAVKDTAKEICEFILKYWQGHDLVECDWLRVAIAEKYGVEVE